MARLRIIIQGEKPITISNTKKLGALTWIASYPKSGNTWIRSIIHAGLTGSMDINRLDFTSSGFASKVANFHRKKIELKHPEEAQQFWAQCQRRLNFDLNGKKIFLKTHNAALKFAGEKFPISDASSGVIYIVRDPRDIVLSYSNHYRIPPKEAFDRISNPLNHIWATESQERFEYLSSWDAHVQSWISVPIPKLILRYEDMLNSPQQNIHKVFEFLRLKPIVNTNTIVKLTSFDSLSKQESSYGFKEAVNGTPFFRRGMARQWAALDRELLNEITATFGKTMAKFRYS